LYFRFIVAAPLIICRDVGVAPTGFSAVSQTRELCHCVKKKLPLLLDRVGERRFRIRQKAYIPSSGTQAFPRRALIVIHKL